MFVAITFTSWMIGALKRAKACPSGKWLYTTKQQKRYSSIIGIYSLLSNLNIQMHL